MLKCLLAVAFILMVTAAYTAPLLDFTNPKIVNQWEGLECTTVQIQNTPGIRFNVPTWTEGQDPWPGVSIAYGRGYSIKNWSRYGKFAFEVLISGNNPPNPTDLAVELRDNQEPRGAITHFNLKPGQINAIELNFENAPIDLNNVKEIAFFCTRPINHFNVTLMNLSLFPADPPEPVYEQPTPIIIIEERPVIIIEERPVIINPWPPIIINPWPRNDHYTSPDYRRGFAYRRGLDYRRDNDWDRDQRRYQPRPPVFNRGGGLLDQVPVTRKPIIIAPNPHDVRGPIIRSNPPVNRSPVVRPNNPPATRGPITRPNHRGPITGPPANQ
jgi:hypothetical protein